MLLTVDLSALSSIDFSNCRIMNNGDVNFKFSEFWKNAEYQPHIVASTYHHNQSIL
jgi:hypothetical protein